MDDHELEIERAKLALEREKLKVEWFKAWIGMPLVALALTAGVTIWAQYQKGSDDFALKAAEIVMNASTPVGSANKAAALRQIFPDRLPANFASSFGPESLPYPVPVSDNTPKKADIFAAAAAKAATADQVFVIARAVYSDSPDAARIASKSKPPVQAAGTESADGSQRPRSNPSLPTTYCDDRKGSYCEPQRK